MEGVVFITGTSSGIGKETSLYFAARGWNVVATMRHPENRMTELHRNPQITLIHLDVVEFDSIKNAIALTIEKFGRIDVVVNNAGYAVFGPFEASTREQARKQMETNLLGLMDITREIIPFFRREKKGMIVNVVSVGGRIAFPFYSIYNATKWAAEGFCESLHYELEPFGIGVKIIEPGIIRTDFYERSMDVHTKEGLADYDEDVQRMDENFRHLPGSIPVVVARCIYKAVTDEKKTMRYRVGRFAGLFLFLRRILPFHTFRWLMRSIMLRKRKGAL